MIDLYMVGVIRWIVYMVMPAFAPRMDTQSKTTTLKELVNFFATFMNYITTKKHRHHWLALFLCLCLSVREEAQSKMTMLK